MSAELERAELEGYVDFVRAAPAGLAESQGIAALDLGRVKAVALAALPGSRMFNHAFGVSSAEELDALADFYAECGCAYAVSPAPGAEIDELLASRGFTPGYAWMKFRRPAEPATRPATDLRVEEIGPAEAEPFGWIVASGFELPDFVADLVAELPGREGWTCYLSFAGDEPVGAGAFYRSGDAAWFTWGATLPAFRGRGSQSALFAARVGGALELGCTVLVTETGAAVDGERGPSYRNILRAGFEEQYLRPNWASPAA